MPFDTTTGLFDEVDVNHDGNIDQNEFSQWARSGLSEDVNNSSSKIIKDDFSTVSHAGTDFGTDASYNAYGSFDAGANAVFDKMDWNGNNVIERSEFNQFISDGSTTVSKSSTGDYVSKYRVDSRGLFVDPDPEIIIRPNPSPAPTYTQKITIRYLKPPPLPPMGENIIREVRAPPLRAPSPFVIREPGKPGSQLPALVLRERPAEPPPTTRSLEKTVMVPPLPAPPRSIVTEKFPNLPDRPRDIILERWLPYEAPRFTRTVRIPAPRGPLPNPPRNLIIQYQPLKVSIIHEIQRLGVTQADPQAYIQRYGSSLLNSARFLQLVRAAGVFEDISPPAGALIRFNSSAYGQADGLNRSFLGDSREKIITGSSEYSRAVESESAFNGFKSSKKSTHRSKLARGFRWCWPSTKPERPKEFSALSTAL